MKDFKISFSLADSEYLTAVRLVCGAICSAADVDVDGAEDFKVCVTESCLMLKSCGFEEADIAFSRGEGVFAQINGLGGVPVEGDCEFSLALLSALLSDFSIEREGGAVSKLSLRL